MAQKVTGFIKLQIPAGKATPAPPVGPALGQHGVNIMAFTKEFNERTKNDIGMIIPVVITVYADRSFTFITKTPPAAVLIKKACGIDTASGEPNKNKVANITKENWMDFDVVIASPDMMGLVGRLGKVLGPRGLMPNPKAGTVTPDVAKAVTEAKAGKIEYRLDKTNIIHCPIGKASFGADKLTQNFETLMEAIVKAKPAAAKGTYLKSCVVTSTMGVGVRVATSKYGV